MRNFLIPKLSQCSLCLCGAIFLPPATLSGWLQEAPAQTTGYMIAGYTVIFGVMLLYLVSLIVRRRSLLQDLAALEELDKSSH